ncbi:hypothetical protein BDV19DRAFT_386233 [Aspergillus venezuelensis]
MICQYNLPLGLSFPNIELDETNILRVRPASKPNPRALAKAQSLADLLPFCRIGSPEIYNLAAILICSTIQLSQTPWLRQGLSKERIYFKSASNEPTYTFQFPYLHNTFQSNQKQSITAPANDSSLLLSLAVVLLEIATGKTIEDLRQPIDAAANAETSNYLTTSRSLVASDLPTDYKIAVFTGAKAFYDPNANLASPEYVKDIKTDVLGRIEQELSYSLSTPAR